MSCFVPNCKNTVGVPFPRDTSVRKLWIESLELKNSPTPSSFICLEHFNACDLNDECETAPKPSLSHKIKGGAVPCIKNPKGKANNAKGSSVEFVTFRKEDEPKALCRICNTDTSLEKCIYDPIEGKIPIMSIIMLCCYPVLVTKTDKLPKFICTACLKQLRESHKFRLKCLETDEMWRKKESSENKRKLSAAAIETDAKKVCIAENSETNSSGKEERDPLDISDTLRSMKRESEELDDGGKCKTRTKTTVAEVCGRNYDSTVSCDEAKSNEEINNKTVQISKNDPPPLVPFDHPPPLVPIERKGSQQTGSAVTAKKYEEIERSLEAIHGITDARAANKELVEKVKREVKSPKRANYVTSGKAVAKPHTVIKIGSWGEKVITLPKGITVVQAEAVESSRGNFPCTLTYGLQGSVFVMANEYLFTFGLLKGNIRHLHCVLPTCKASATQKLLDNGTYEETINVKVPHNHAAPSEQVRKKHMFFFVMRKRMQLDKTLNIRNIYEEVCNLEPEIRTLVPLRNVINEICRYQISNKVPQVNSFEDFYDKIESEAFEKLHFTNSNHQFYQERFIAEDDTLAIVFCNTEVIEHISESKIMYVDASFKIETNEDFKYQLITVLVWVDDSYYPILFALANKKTQEIFRKIFKHLHDVLAPNLKPHEIVTDYEANLYYALGETYLDSHIGGSVFYYTQNLYKKICALNLSRDLETNSNFRNMYHMLLMLPLLPVNTILDGLNNIEVQARDNGLSELARPVFDHIRSQWILNVTPELFCVHRLENRINENVIAPFKKLRDFLLLFKGKVNQSQITVVQVVEKLIELESFLHGMYSKMDKKSFGRDLSSFQKKNVVRAWQFVEAHPKININSFFQKVLGYIKCMENQLWIWGFYRYKGDTDDVLINANNFSILANDGVEEDGVVSVTEELVDEETSADETVLNSEDVGNPTILVEAVIDNDGGVMLQTDEESDPKHFEKAFLNYVQYQ